MKKNKKPLLYRQGDVLVERIDDDVVTGAAIPREGGRVILAAGELTGHHHAIASKAVEFFQEKKALALGARILKVHQPADLSHEEHSTIRLPAGTYKVSIQREYHPAELRQVAD